MIAYNLPPHGYHHIDRRHIPKRLMWYVHCIVFVFFDTYSETLPLHQQFSPVVRLSHAYHRAGAAMAVTSFTSAAAFMANIISAIPAVRSFGMFLATMVAVNYILVMTWFPSCIAFWEKYTIQQRSEVSLHHTNVVTIHRQ